MGRGTCVLVVVWFAACGRDSLAPLPERSERSTPPDAPSAPQGSDPSAPQPGDDTPEVAAPPSWGDGSSCIPAPSGDAFVHAFCACGDVALGGGFTVHASDTGAFSRAGVNGNMTAQGATEVRSTIVVVGELLTRGGLEVTGDVHSNNTVEAVGHIEVGGDVQAGGDLLGSSVAVGRALAVAGDVIASGGVTSGARVGYPGDVGPPCACEPGQRLDVAALVAAASVHNDNDALGVTAGTTGALTLSSGRYYLFAAQLTGLDVHVAGEVSLFIAGDLDSAAAAWLDRLTIGDGARLSLFIEGDVLVFSGIDFDADDGELAVFLGGEGSTVAVAGALQLRGSLYAPATRFEVQGGVTVRGAMLVGALQAQGPLLVGAPRGICE